jgi:hypothetical protein
MFLRRSITIRHYYISITDYPIVVETWGIRIKLTHSGNSLSDPRPGSRMPNQATGNPARIKLHQWLAALMKFISSLED